MTTRGQKKSNETTTAECGAVQSMLTSNSGTQIEATITKASQRSPLITVDVDREAGRGEATAKDSTLGKNSATDPAKAKDKSEPEINSKEITWPRNRLLIR